MADGLTQQLLVDPALHSAYSRDYIGISPTLDALEKLTYVLERDNEKQRRRQEQNLCGKGRGVFVSIHHVPTGTVMLTWTLVGGRASIYGGEV